MICRLAAGPVAALALGLALLAGCAPVERPAGPAGAAAPYLDRGLFVAHDGARLPYRLWQPADDAPPATAVVVAVHGFNDYSNFFERPAAWLAERGVISYAYDQRGFGLAPNRGMWAGTETYARDLLDVMRAVKRRHPDLPVHVLGNSMGGAVTLVAFARADAPDVDGVILTAPAVWGRETMPFYQRWMLELSSHLLPAARLRPKGLDIKPSDNIEMLLELARDPLVIKDTRIDAVYGLVGLMDAGLAAAPGFTRRLLLLYGYRDDIIPKEPINRLIERLPVTEGDRQRILVYRDAYHMMLRGLQAERVWRDIRRWIDDPAAPLPSPPTTHAAGGG